MTRRYAQGTSAAMLRLRALADKLLDYPAAGQHVGGGRHVDMPDAYTPGAPGWTATHGEPRKHPARLEYAYPIDGDIEGALADDAQRKRLQLLELLELDAAEVAAIELDATWQNVDAAPKAIER